MTRDADMSGPLLSMEGVTAGYLGDIDVLRNVSLEVHAGRISGLIGLNGAEPWMSQVISLKTVSNMLMVTKRTPRSIIRRARRQL